MPCERRYLHLTKVALIGLCLMGLLSSCATDPIVQTRTEVLKVPESLLTPCTKSELAGNTYQAAIELAIKRGLDLDACNAQLEGIRKWSSQN